MNKKNVVIAGGKGLVGERLIELLSNKGHTVHILTRTPNSDYCNEFYWNVEEKNLDLKYLRSADAIVNLSGENIGAHRWTERQKKIIQSSRIHSNRLLIDKIAKLKCKPEVFISASAVGYYGNNNGDYVFTEGDAPSDDFLGETCSMWEDELIQASKLGVRTVAIRTGLVLSQRGGVYNSMIKPLKFRFAPVFGNGKQILPWIHIDDLCNIYIEAIENSKLSGPYNAVAPAYCSNSEFMKNLILTSKRSVIGRVRVPRFLLKIFLGERSVLLLNGAKVSSEKLQNEGFQFKYPSLEKALFELNNQSN